MARKGSVKTPLTILIISFTLLATLSNHLRHNVVYQSTSLYTSLRSSSLSSPPLSPRPPPPPPPLELPSSALTNSLLNEEKDYSSATSSPSSISTVSILIPDWEVLVIASPDTPRENYTCIFGGNSSSPASFAGELSFSRRTVFKCVLPENIRRRSQYTQPRLAPTVQTTQIQSKETNYGDLLKWNSLVYESFTTQHDVVLFVKGVNTRQGHNRPPSSLRCVFGDDPTTAVRTPVTSSAQEVFRCVRPDFRNKWAHKISVTLEIIEGGKEANTLLLPSVAQYATQERRTVEFNSNKSLMCACTMVYNVGKFLREWVTYHASVGVDKFILYDNDSDDGLDRVVDRLNRAGFDVRTVYWPWPKTQEAGFSHCALYAQQLCHWMAFVDVDEFVLSPTWLDHKKPDRKMLTSSLLPKLPNPGSRVGQVSVKCVEFGPSNQTTHPAHGVTQGYTCRRSSDRRHKSIVLLEAVHPSLTNMVHHFQLKEGFKTKILGKQRAVVNHYKYQAWPEFRAKFRRRVSAYVVDWQQTTNVNSNDRVPGLGFRAIQPPGWARKFCDKKDERLKMLTTRWFRVNSSAMIWQTG